MTLGSSPAAAMPGLSSGSNSSSGKSEAAPVVSKMIWSGLTLAAIFCMYLSMSVAHARTDSRPCTFWY